MGPQLRRFIRSWGRLSMQDKFRILITLFLALYLVNSVRLHNAGVHQTKLHREYVDYEDHANEGSHHAAGGAKRIVVMTHHHMAMNDQAWKDKILKREARELQESMQRKEAAAKHLELHKYDNEPRLKPVVQAIRYPPEDAKKGPFGPDFKPEDHVAWAIPVGGRTKRAPQLERMINTLLTGGVSKENIFVIEDNMSRDDPEGDPDVAAVCKRLDIQLVPSDVTRDFDQVGEFFGLFLARHYHFMLDYVFLGGSPTEVEIDGEAVDIHLSARPNANQPKTSTDMEEIIGNPHLCSGIAGHSTRVAEKSFEYLVIVEDDLELAPDIAHFFHGMARVMRADPSLYCACAHQDNAWLSMAQDPIDEVNGMAALDFDFRRGNHFMAPGWMTSRKVYLQRVRPNWLNRDGFYSYKTQFRLRNGHWDRFWDSQIEDLECIFPEVPRVVHRGADGFTVSKQGQDELYSNIRLSNLAANWDYGDLSRLTSVRYDEDLKRFIAESTSIHSFSSIRLFRDSRLLIVLDVNSDSDFAWNSALSYFGAIGIGGGGGWPGYMKQRGVHKGSIFLRYLSNVVLLVGRYSPFMDHVSNKLKKLDTHSDGVALLGDHQVKLAYAGCFKDTWERDLDFFADWINPSSLAPHTCLEECILMGFRYAGLQMGVECWCGNSYGKHEQLDESVCDKRCDSSAGRHTSNKWYDSFFEWVSKSSMPCGGALANSIYYLAKNEEADEAHASALPTDVSEHVHPLVLTSDSGTVPKFIQDHKPHRDDEANIDAFLASAFVNPADLEYVKSDPGKSCDDACAARSSKCMVHMMPLIHRNCLVLKDLLGCGTCADHTSAGEGMLAPSFELSSGAFCIMGSGKYDRCSSSASGHVRACVCGEHKAIAPAAPATEPTEPVDDPAQGGTPTPAPQVVPKHAPSSQPATQDGSDNNVQVPELGQDSVVVPTQIQAESEAAAGKQPPAADSQ